MTEKLWQERKHFHDENAKNMNKILKRTFDDKKDKIPTKHFKELYAECLKGSLDLVVWGSSKDLTVDDMAMLACRDVGCELNYCQTSMTDPYEKPFENCESQHKQLVKCINQEVDIYETAPKGTLQEHLKLVLKMKKENKYKHLFETEVVPITTNNIEMKEEFNKMRSVKI